MKKKVSGQIRYSEIEGGFWYLHVKDTGEDYVLLDMPDQLKHKDLNVTMVLQVYEENFSMHMTGTPAKIISFETPVL